MFWERFLVIKLSSYLFPNPVLRTHIWKNYIILFIIYDVLICFVVFTGLRTGQYDWFMRWWKSRLGQGLLQSYNLLLIVMYFYPASPDTLVPTLAITRGRYPTQMSTVSTPESPPLARGHPPTRVYPVSVPKYRLPDLLLRILLAPTAWIALPVTSSSLITSIFLPRLP